MQIKFGPIPKKLIGLSGYERLKASSNLSDYKSLLKLIGKSELYKEYDSSINYSGLLDEQYELARKRQEAHILSRIELLNKSKGVSEYTFELKRIPKPKPVMIKLW